MVWASLGISIGAAVFAGFSALFAWRQVGEAGRLNALPVLVDLLQEFRGLDPERRFIFQTLPSYSPSLGISRLPDDARENVLRVYRFMEQFGLLVREGVVRPEVASGFMRMPILRTWAALKPYIEAERVARREPFGEFSEDLAARVLEVDWPSLLKHLRSVPPDAELPAIHFRDGDPAPPVHTVHTPVQSSTAENAD